MSNKGFVITCLAALPYLLTLNGDFVFDDSEAIVKNKDVTSESWTDPFYNDFWGADIKSNLSHKSYRPLTILSFRLNYLINRKALSPLQFKATNLICHIIACLLLWQVCDVINNKWWRYFKIRKKIIQDTPQNIGKWWMDTAYLTTLLFAVHPIHVEPVAGIVGRADLLAAITFFLAFLCYDKAMMGGILSPFWILLAVTLSGISMLFKENGITVLGFCIAYEIVTKVRLKDKENSNKNVVISKGKIHIHVGLGSILRIMCISTAIVVLLYERWKVMGGTRPEFKQTENPAAFADSIFVRIATLNYIYLLNIVILIWPNWLCYDWSMGCVPLIEDITDNRLIFVFAFFLYGLVFWTEIFYGRNRKPFKRKLLLGLALIVIPFLPATNIFYPVGFVIAERVLYIPSAGFCYLVMVGFNKILYRRSVAFCKIAVFMLLLVLMVLSVRSWQRAIEWHNEYYLFVSGLSVCPLNAKVHYNVAKAADANYQMSWALAEYKEAIRLYPEYYQAMNNLANLLKNQKQFTEAEYFLKEAVKYKQDFPAAWMNLGIVLASTRRFEESEAAYKIAISYRSKYPDCYYNLGNLYLEMNRTDDAMNSWYSALDLHPKHVLAWTNLMALLDNTGQLDKALKVIPRVLTEVPEAPSINFAIANIYGKLRRYSEAESHFKKAIKLYGKDVQALHYANLGVLYHRWDKFSLAEEMYTKALKIDHKFKTARRNLDNLRKINY